VQFWLASQETYNEKEYEGIFRRCFNQVFNATDEIVVQFKDTTAQTRQLRVYDSASTLLYTGSFSEAITGLYQISFTPGDQSITSDEIQLKVTTNTGTELAKSDSISIKPEHDETVLINYHNNRVFLSLNSSVGTPDPEFNLRVPAVFFKERFPEESEVIELSGGRSVQLMAQVKAQKLLSVGPVPFYMHRKIKLALSFQNVVIDDGEEWVKEEAYEIADTQRTNPLSKATCWLTEKDYIARNIL
jgi:hypothetical protein